MPKYFLLNIYKKNYELRFNFIKIIFRALWSKLTFKKMNFQDFIQVFVFGHL